MGRQTDYLFKRKGSSRWYCRLQYRGEAAQIMGTQIEDIALGTTDKAEAAVLALPHIQRHKLFLLTLRNAREGTLTQERGLRYEPGREHVTEDGTRVIATAQKLIHILADGTIREEPNPHVVRVTLKADPDTKQEIDRVSPPPKKTADDDVLETWISHNGIEGRVEEEARAVWATWRSIVGKPLNTATRDDGRKLANYFFKQGNKSATVGKKIGLLRAACNLAIDEHKLTLNPFVKVVKKVEDGTVRLPLSEDDMSQMRARLDELDPEDRLLWALLATTGMRRGEAFHISEEFSESGIRYVFVGSKTAQSERRVPLPHAAISLMPAEIVGPLFSDLEKNHGRRLNRMIRRVGITDERKVLHSLRHRAKDRLRAAECPLDIQYHLLGHEEETVASGYGVGYPISVLKFWIDKIGL